MSADTRTPRQIEWERVPSQDEIDATLFRARRLGILLNKTREPDGPGAPGCWLGGEPTLPPEIEWPWFRHPDNEKCAAPLHFVAQIDLQYLPRLATQPEMPTSGTLFFFFDPIAGWEYPEGGRVFYVPGDVSQYPPRPTPEMPEIDPDNDLGRWDCYIVRPTKGYRRWNIDFMVFEGFKYQDLPNRINTNALLSSTIELEETLYSLTKDRRIEKTSKRRVSQHHIFGSFGSITPYSDHDNWVGTWYHITKGEEPYEDLFRLLSIEGDDEIGFPDGWIVFYMRPDDYKNGRFERGFTITERS